LFMILAPHQPPRFETLHRSPELPVNIVSDVTRSSLYHSVTQFNETTLHETYNQK